jgi:hypothetical protein
MDGILDKRWIRVSSILSKFYPLDHIDHHVLARKAKIGQGVHQAIAAHLKGEFPVCSDEEEGYFESFLAWYKLAKLVPQRVEERFYSEALNLTGAVDVIGYHKTSMVCIYDFKCTSAPSEDKWKIQAALYHILIKLNSLILEPFAFFIQLDKDGHLPKVYEYELTDELQNTALAMYRTYMYLTKKQPHN